MKKPTPEFSRPIEVARIPSLGSHERIAADAKECAALAGRLKLPAVHFVEARLHIAPWRGGGFKVTGGVRAGIDQVSVVSLETFRNEVSFPVERYFLPRLDEESEADIDVIQDGAIDLGEVAVETIGLELDPYPRMPGETFAESLQKADEEPARVSPFAVLKSQKPR